MSDNERDDFGSPIVRALYEWDGLEIPAAPTWHRAEIPPGPTSAWVEIEGRCGDCDKPTNTLPCPHCQVATQWGDNR